MRNSKILLKKDDVDDVGKLFLPMNLQLFAEDSSDVNEDTGEDEEEEDNEDDEEAGGDEDAEDNVDNKSHGGKGKKKEKTFTQSQVNKMMAREKRQGKRAALKEFGLEGMTKKEAEEFKKWREEQKTEEEKKAEKRAADEMAAKEINAKVAKAEVKAEALVAGAKSKYLDDVIVLALAIMKDDEDIDAEAAVEEVKTKHKLFFTKDNSDDDSTDEKDKKGKRGTGKSPKEDKNKGTNKSLGARLAASKKGAKKTTSKFFN